MKNILLVLIVAIASAIGFLVFSAAEPRAVLDSTPTPMTISGEYECLPPRGGGPSTTECAFGIKTDDGTHYAVNFGQSGEAMELFQAGAHIKAHGFLVIREALSTDHWDAYDMKGIFTVTEVLESGMPTPAGKLDIAAVCSGALAYMSFPDGASADAFVSACIEGKHPEVIERFKADNGVDGAAI